LDHRHLGHAQLSGCHDPTVPGDDAAVSVHKDRIREPELPDTGGNLRHLFIAMRPAVAGIRDQAIQRGLFVGREIVFDHLSSLANAASLTVSTARHAPAASWHTVNRGFVTGAPVRAVPASSHLPTSGGSRTWHSCPAWACPQRGRASPARGTGRGPNGPGACASVVLGDAVSLRSPPAPLICLYQSSLDCIGLGSDSNSSCDKRCSAL